jgi:hypothetical protein
MYNDGKNIMVHCWVIIIYKNKGRSWVILLLIIKGEQGIKIFLIKTEQVNKYF